MKRRDKFDVNSYVPWDIKRIKKVKGLIYKALNLINNNFYLGKTIQTLEERKKEHLKSKNNYVFPKALKKYPEENKWQWIILAEYPHISLNELGYLEMVAIWEMKPQYNMTKGGEGVGLLEYTPEIRFRLGNGNRGRKYTKEESRNMGKARLGQKLSAKQIQSIVDSNKARIWKEESRIKSRETQKGVPKHTQEFKDYMRTVHLGKKVNRTEEHKKNLAIALAKPVARIIDNQIVSVFPSARITEKKLKIRARRYLKSGNIHPRTKSYFKYITHEEYEHLVTVLNIP